MKPSLAKACSLSRTVPYAFIVRITCIPAIDMRGNTGREPPSEDHYLNSSLGLSRCTTRVTTAVRGDRILPLPQFRCLVHDGLTRCTMLLARYALRVVRGLKIRSYSSMSASAGVGLYVARYRARTAGE